MDKFMKNLLTGLPTAQTLPIQTRNKQIQLQAWLEQGMHILKDYDTLAEPAMQAQPTDGIGPASSTHNMQELEAKTLECAQLEKVTGVVTTLLGKKMEEL